MKAPAFQLYASDFYFSTMDMTAEEVGGYIRLLCYQWDKGSIPDDEKKLMNLSGCTSTALASILVKFTKESDGLLRNKRLEEVRLKQLEFSESRAKNAKARWSSKCIASDMHSTMRNGCITDALQSPTPTPTPTLTSTQTQELKYPKHLTNNFKTVFVSWIDFRKKKKACKDFYRLFQEQLEFLGRYDEPTAIEILRYSLRNDYQGLFEPKNGAKPIQKIVESRNLNLNVND